MSSNTKGFRLAVLQIPVTKNKDENLKKALEKIRYVVKEKGAQVVALPECFNSPYGMEHFDHYAEEIPTGETCQMLSKAAKEFSIYIIGGSLPERDPKTKKLHNTCTIWNPDGTLQAIHRKIHLYDVDVPGDITFQESSVLTPGSKMTIVEIFGHKVGICICHDIRFEEMAKLYRKKGCKMMVYPAAFDMKTGVMHFELLARSRANDNQLYVVTVSPCRDTSAGYVAWGYSTIVDPWGQVLHQAKDKEEIIVADIDFTVNDKVQSQIPIFKQRRTDIYETIEK